MDVIDQRAPSSCSARAAPATIALSFLARDAWRARISRGRTRTPLGLTMHDLRCSPGACCACSARGPARTNSV
eukprot:5376019-Pyramimonas_sp.AAC.1